MLAPRPGDPVDRIEPVRSSQVAEASLVVYDELLESRDDRHDR